MAVIELFVHPGEQQVDCGNGNIDVVPDYDTVTEVVRVIAGDRIDWWREDSKPWEVWELSWSSL